MNPFQWLRTWARDSILAGVSDAAALLDPGEHDPTAAADAFLRRLAAPVAAPDGNGRPDALPGPADAAEGTPAAPARKRREGRP